MMVSASIIVVLQDCFLCHFYGIAFQNMVMFCSYGIYHFVGKP